MKALLFLTINSFLFAFAAFPAQAKNTCKNGKNTLFYCVTQNNKEVEVCHDDNTLSYRFGKTNGAAEISFTKLKSEVTGYRWEGFGRNMPYYANIPNGDVTYTVHWSIEKKLYDHIDPEPVAGITVTDNKTDKILANINCNMKTVVHNLMDVELPKEQNDN